MACLQLRMSEVPAELWERQTKGMVDVSDTVGPGSVNFGLWNLVACAVLNGVQWNMVAEAGDTMTKYFDSSHSVVRHDEMSK